MKMQSIRKLTRTAVLCLALAALAGMPAGARAADDGGGDRKVEARRCFAAGVQRAKEGAYERAMAEFVRAYELSPNYAVLYNIGEMQRALGNAAGALDAFQRYLLEGGAAVPAARRAKVNAAVEALRAETATLTIQLTPPAGADARPTPLTQLTIDGKAIDRDASARPIRVNGGRHTIAATADGGTTVEQEVEVASGQAATVSLTLAVGPSRPAAPAAAAPDPTPETTASPAAPAPAALPSPAPPPHQAAPPAAADTRPPAPSHGRRNLSVATAALGVGSLALATGAYFLAKSRWQAAVDQGCTRDSCTGAARDAYDGAGRALTVFNVTVIAGGVLLVAGTVLYLTAPSESARAARSPATPRRALALAVAPAIAADGGGVTLVGRW
jgi:hypothetical protein